MTEEARELNQRQFCRYQVGFHKIYILYISCFSEKYSRIPKTAEKIPVLKTGILV